MDNDVVARHARSQGEGAENADDSVTVEVYAPAEDTGDVPHERLRRRVLERERFAKGKVGLSQSIHSGMNDRTDGGVKSLLLLAAFMVGSNCSGREGGKVGGGLG